MRTGSVRGLQKSVTREPFLSIVVAVVLFGILLGLGILLSKRTSLDLTALLLLATVITAFWAGYHAHRQVEVAQRQVEVVREGTTAQLRPFLMFEENVPDTGARPDGLFRAVKNHGGGLARSIRYRMAITLGEDGPDPIDFNWERTPVFLRYNGEIAAIGSGHTVIRRFIPWDAIPDELRNERGMIYRTYCEFNYETVYGPRETQPLIMSAGRVRRLEFT